MATSQETPALRRKLWTPRQSSYATLWRRMSSTASEARRLVFLNESSWISWSRWDMAEGTKQWAK